jgi:DNA-binding transcriptional LysR family regulator
MRLAEIEAFRALMGGGSTRKAAALLGVSQPAISLALKRLEGEAGFLLFERRRGGLHATPEARAFLAEVDKVFVGLSSLQHRLKSLRVFGLEQLRVDCYPAFGLGFVPRALALAKAKGGNGPQVSLQILSSREVRDRVLRGDADFGLMADELPVLGLTSSVFATMPGVVVMPQGHPLARLRQVSARQLSETCFIALNPEDAYMQRLQRELSASGIALTPSFVTPYGASVCELALHGLGAGIANPITALDYVGRGLCMRRLAVQVNFSCLLVQPGGGVLSGVARDFLGVLRRQLVQDEKSIREHLGR